MDLWTVTVSVVSSGVVSAAIVFGLKKYLGSYLEEKGKNLATHEDIMKLVDQVRETERVKAEITDNVWDRQQRWTGKHAMYRELIEAVYSAVWASMEVATKVKQNNGIPTPEIVTLNEKFLQCVRDFYILASLASISVSDEANKTLKRLLTIDLSDDEKTSQFISALADLIVAARIDLGYPPFSLRASEVNINF